MKTQAHRCLQKKTQLIIEKYLDIKNPYKLIKDKNLKIAKQFIPYLQALVNNSADKLEMALRTAIIGNTIDLGANPNFNIEDEVHRISSGSIQLPVYPKFKEISRKRISFFISVIIMKKLFSIKSFWVNYFRKNCICYPIQCDTQRYHT